MNTILRKFERVSQRLRDIEPIEESITIEAEPEAVWAIVSDVRRMGEWSPECRRVFVPGGDVRHGGRIIGVNQRKLVVWPTICTIYRYDEGRAIGWRVLQNRAHWSYAVHPDSPRRTRLVEQREMPDGAPLVAALFAQGLLGGAESHEEEVRAGMRTTLQRIKAAAES